MDSHYHATVLRAATGSTVIEIFIGNIPYDATADELERLLMPHGRVDRVHLPVDASGQPRGFGFATMPVRSQAAAAIVALDGTRLRGRPLRVNEAEDRKRGRPRSERAVRPASSGRPGVTGFRRGPMPNPIPPPRAVARPPTGTRVNPVRPHTLGGVMAAAAFALVLGTSVFLDFVSPSIVAVYATLSLFTYVVYAVDKHSARTGHWRIAEFSLHLLALAGGWPGASLARHRLRHKTIKQPFRTVFAITILLNCAGFAWLFSADGASVQQGLDRLIAAYASRLD